MKARLWGSLLFVCVQALNAQASNAAIIAGANCFVGWGDYSGSTGTACPELNKTISGENLNIAGSVTAGTLLEASYTINYGVYGHLGASTQVFLSGPRETSYRVTLASATVGLTAIDSFVVESSSYANGFEVPLALSFKVDGNSGLNLGEPGSYPNSVYSHLRGYVSVFTNEGYFQTLPFCAYSLGSIDCATLPLGRADFDIHGSKEISVQVGHRYYFQSVLQLDSAATLNMYEYCGAFDFCDVGTYLNVSNSLRTYLTPSMAGYQVVADSGHDYTLSPVPEPGSLALLLTGACGIALVRRKGL